MFKSIQYTFIYHNHTGDTIEIQFTKW